MTISTQPGYFLTIDSWRTSLEMISNVHTAIGAHTMEEQANSPRGLLGIAGWGGRISLAVSPSRRAVGHKRRGIRTYKSYIQTCTYNGTESSHQPQTTTTTTPVSRAESNARYTEPSIIKPPHRARAVASPPSTTLAPPACHAIYGTYF